MDYERPHFIAGTEKRFSDYIRTLGEATKIIVVSHTDVDGIGSAKIVDVAIEADAVYLVDYEELTLELAERLKLEGPSHVIFTDLMLKREFVTRVSQFAHVLIIDHHRMSEDVNSQRITFLNAQGMCATYLAWWLFRRVGDLSAWEWLVACACIADVMTDEVRTFMIAQFQKKGLDFNQGVKQGTFWEFVTQVNNALIYYNKDRMQVYKELMTTFALPDVLREPARLVEQDIQDALKRFEQEKEVIKERLFWEFSATYPIKSVVTTMLSFSYPKTTIIIVEIRGSTCYISGRCQDRHEDMNLLLKKLIAGFPDSDAGGHIPAAGGHFPVVKLAEFKKRLETF